MRVKLWLPRRRGISGGVARWCGCTARSAGCALFLGMALVAGAGFAGGQQEASGDARTLWRRAHRPAQAQAHERFAASRGRRTAARVAELSAQLAVHPATQSNTAITWNSLGPQALVSANYGLVTGRVTALAFDPADSSGNTLYVGTTGGGIWRSTNAATSIAAGTADSSSYVSFTALTDSPSALSGIFDASISIGALSVQPGGTGVILAGTGDPNDLMDSYGGAGILRSSDGGNTWSLISATSDTYYSFFGEGFAGFAWSTSSPNLVVAAVSQAWGSVLANEQLANNSYEGLYYSTDAGASWSLATISDGSSGTVQSGSGSFVSPDGTAATSVVWNPVRKLFIAAVRYHGYYSSSNGVTWTRLADSAQPGPSASPILTESKCPAGSARIACPIFRGALAVNPSTGDTFAWTVDYYNQDQGIWEDLCNASSGSCASTLAFNTQWNTAALESNDANYGAATIEDGDYNLLLAAIPYGSGEMLVAGAHDLWRSYYPLSQGGSWRNLTNSTVGFCSGVGEYQHVLASNISNPSEVFVGNDSGLWRSLDMMGVVTTSSCAASDATHFQNLNGSLGSLAEVSDLSDPGSTPYTILGAFGDRGAAGVKGATGAVSHWQQVLGGLGGTVAIDPQNSNTWYVNAAAGVSIYGCTSSSLCTSSGFGSAPLIDSSDVGGDGAALSYPAPFLVDPLDHTQLLVGTCRLWRGSAAGSWSSANLISGFFDGATDTSVCSGDAPARVIAAQALSVSKEILYVGTHGTLTGGTLLPGHVLTAVYDASASATPTWSDLSSHAVANSSYAFNAAGYDISAITIDPHDTTGNTIYVAIDSASTNAEPVDRIYRSTNGGSSWSQIAANLIDSPVNAIVVDPNDAATVYVATDRGVFATRSISSCVASNSNCWSSYGSGLPLSPVVTLKATTAGASVAVLVAGTYGRGIWMAPLWSSSALQSAATLSSSSLSFGSTAYGMASNAQTITVTNSGSNSLSLTAVTSSSSDFIASSTCLGAVVNPGLTCTITVYFTPTALGARSATLTLDGNIASTLSVALSGTGSSAGVISLSQSSLAFGTVTVGQTSSALSLAVANNSTLGVAIAGVATTAPFAVKSTTCSGTLAAGSSCQVSVTYSPTTSGASSATLTVTDAMGTQSAALTGTALTAASDSVTPASLTFSSTGAGMSSASQSITLVNNGQQSITAITQSITSGATAFSIASTTCGTTLAGSASCTISVQFNPPQATSYSGTLTLSDYTTTTQTHAIALTGTGVTAPSFVFSPASLSFTGGIVGQASTAQSVTLSNPGALPINGLTLQLAGYSASCVSSANYCFTLSSNTCGSTLAAGASCSFQIGFTPLAAGNSTATLTASSTTIASKTLAISGTATSTTSLSVAPSALSFSMIEPGSSSSAQLVTVSNAGSVSAAPLVLSIAAPFSLVQDGCSGNALAAGSSCTVGVIFSPTLAQSYSGTLSISSTTATSAASVALSGTGGTPGSVTASPLAVLFSQTSVGLTSDATTVTFTNPSTTQALTSFSLSVTPAKQFVLVNNTCGSTLAAGASCTVGVEFTPQQAGTVTGSLNVSSALLSNGATVSLSGLGFNFLFSSTSGAQSIAAGSSATYTLVLKPLNGSSGVFALSCASLPSYSTCTFNPSKTIGVGAGLSDSFTVIIATDQSTSSSSAHRGTSAGLALLPVLCGFALLIPLRRGWRNRLFMLLLAASFGLMTSCATTGGGTGSIPINGNGITPTGTYTIVVTATSGGLSQSVDLSLTVD